MYPDANRLGTTITSSRPLTCSVVAPASVSGVSMRTPSTSPISAAYMRASPCAVPMPLDEGISAACASGESKSMSGVVTANAGFMSESGSLQAATSVAELLGDRSSGRW